jgi:hypothetical protein
MAKGALEFIQSEPLKKTEPQPREVNQPS